MKTVKGRLPTTMSISCVDERDFASVPSRLHVGAIAAPRALRPEIASKRQLPSVMRTSNTRPFLHSSDTSIDDQNSLSGEAFQAFMGGKARQCLFYAEKLHWIESIVMVDCFTASYAIEEIDCRRLRYNRC